MGSIQAPGRRSSTGRAPGFDPGGCWFAKPAVAITLPVEPRKPVETSSVLTAQRRQGEHRACKKRVAGVATCQCSCHA